MNPSKNIKTDYRPAPVTVAVLVHIPNQLGYFSQRFNVLKLCLESIIKHTDSGYDLLVFDNASCSEVVDYLRALQNKTHIRHLHLCANNIGKLNVLKFIFQAAPGDIVAYSDDDIFFYPGWLAAQLEILKKFPNAAMVSGVAVRHTFSYGNTSCHNFTKENPAVKLEYARKIPDEWEVDWAKNTGRNPKEYLAATADMQDIILHYEGICAFATANHFQFVSPRSIMSRILAEIETDTLMGKMLEMEKAVDAAGYLRLSTMQRFVRHIGNIISPDLSAEAKDLGLNCQAGKTPLLIKSKILSKGPLRRLMEFIYNRLFYFLNADRKIEKL